MASLFDELEGHCAVQAAAAGRRSDDSAMVCDVCGAPVVPVVRALRAEAALEAIRDYDGVAPIASMRRIAKEALDA